MTPEKMATIIQGDDSRLRVRSPEGKTRFLRLSDPMDRFLLVELLGRELPRTPEPPPDRKPKL